MSKIILKYTKAQQAADEALKVIHTERQGEQFGLYCRYPSLNIAMGKYWRFNNVNLIAGLSGHAKSYILNILSDDFLKISKKENQINSNITFIPVVLHFCFEMSAYNEILRSVASDMGVSYGYLLSSEYNKKTKTYNTVTDEEFKRVKKYLEYYANRNILFFETAGNIKLIYNTVEYMYEHYTALGKKNGVEYKLIVNIDHTLLIETLGEKSSLELMANVGKTSIAIRKDFKAMVNLLGQLNNNIEDVRRLTLPALHYPQKSDIYAQSQLYNACDSVFVIHQPQLLKITEYGSRALPTKDLIHLLKLKARHGKVGSIWLKNDLNNGNIIEYPQAENNENDEDKNLEHI